MINKKESAIKRLTELEKVYQLLRKKARFDDLSGGCTDAERETFQSRAAAAIIDIASADSIYSKQIYHANGIIVSPQYLIGIINALKADIEAGHTEFEKSSKVEKDPGFQNPISENQIKNITVKSLLGLLKRLTVGAWGVLIAVVCFIFGLGFQFKDIVNSLSGNLAETANDQPIQNRQTKDMHDQTKKTKGGSNYAPSHNSVSVSAMRKLIEEADAHLKSSNDVFENYELWREKAIIFLKSFDEDTANHFSSATKFKQKYSDILPIADDYEASDLLRKGKAILSGLILTVEEPVK